VIPSSTTYNIQWVEPPETVKFGLKYSMNNGTSWTAIANNITGRSYNWTVPKPIANKTECLIKVMGYNSLEGKVGEDKSDGTFAIEVIKVTSPNGGEGLETGKKWTITWRTNGTARPVAKAILSYTENGGTTWKPIITFNNGYPNPGSYSWTVPWAGSIKSKCKMKVVLTDWNGISVGTDTSDNFFSIINPNPQ